MGAGYIQGGGGWIFFFGDVLGGGVENKNPLGQGGHIFRQEFGGGGVKCVPLVFAFIKSQSFLGAKPPDPPYPK